MPEITNYMFASGDWRTEELTAALPESLRDQNISMSHIDYTSQMYPLALEKVFSFMSSAANGRYSDRTMMTIRRTADRWRDTTIPARSTYINDELGSNPYLPYMFIVESPYSWDEETEIKRGGILGAMICLPNDDVSTVEFSLSQRTYVSKASAKPYWNVSKAGPESSTCMHIKAT